MSINERVREVRNALDLTQKDFGQRLAIAQSYLTNIETGKREVTEKIQKLICLQFNVSDEWLRTGEGEMFVEDDNVLLSQLTKQYNLDTFSRKFIEAYINLPEAHRTVIKDFAQSLSSAADSVRPEPAPEVAIDGSLVRDPEIASELCSYAQELEQEKRAVEKSSVSGDIKEA